MIELTKHDADDRDFHRNTERFVNILAAEYHPPQLYVVAIDNWFSHKWLGYSGKVDHALGVTDPNPILPPFVPDRVKSERCYLPEQNHQGYSETSPSKPIHLLFRNSDLPKRHVDSVALGATFIWYSGRTGINQKGCLMAYVSKVGGYWAWYAGLAKRDGWHAPVLKGISAPEFHRLWVVGTN